MDTIFADVWHALQSRYVPKRTLGSGGAAVVSLAQDCKHNRLVAVKVFRPEIGTAIGVMRFHREIEIAASLAHPHILPLYDSGDVNDVLYYVMPYVEGGSLRERMVRKRRMDIGEAVGIASEIADALSYAHTHGVIHRDIKPENILLESSHAILTDFGIASTGLDGRMTEPGIVVGTPAYMSPEHAMGERTDGRSDVYALGCVLYEMLSGTTPFDGTTTVSILAQKSVGQLPSIRSVRQDVSFHLDGVVTRALARHPHDRFATAGDFRIALECAEAAEPPPQGSVAVLPFTDLSHDPAATHFGAGVAEEITTALTKVKALRVASRTSAFTFRAERDDPRSFGRQLGVAHILEGSVRRVGQSFRISVRLTEVATGYQVWSERFDRELHDVFAVEDEIARRVVEQLAVILTDEERRAISRHSAGSIRAYEFYLRGRQFLHQTRKRSLEFAREMFGKAIDIDPDYALAYAGLADCVALLHMFYPEHEQLVEAEAASKRALALAPHIPETHASHGFVLFQLGREDEADAALHESLRLDPRQYDANYFLGRLRFQQGRFVEAERAFNRAADVREDYESRFFAAQAVAATGDEKAAESAYRRALHVAQMHVDLHPDDPRAATMCAVSCCRVGLRDRGLAFAERALTVDPDDAGVRYNVACLFALEGLTERALDCLEEAFTKGFGNIAWIEKDPDLDSLRSHSRFHALMNRLTAAAR
jgi:TolB-like protein/Flp pilus assembly protein TadD